MKNFRKVSIFLLVLLIAAAGTVPAAASGTEKSQNIVDGVIDFNLREASAANVQEWIDGVLSRDAGQGSEWYVIALSRHGRYDFSKYESALLSYLSQNEVGSASSRLKYALTLTAIGSNAPYISEAADSSIGEQGIMSLIFGLHLLNNGCDSDDYSVSELKEEILSYQLTDGGWSLSGENGDVDVTAMAVQALAPHYSTDNSVRNAVDAAIAFLSDRQQENGGYSSYGVNNPESAAQVLVALSSLGIDSETDSRFIKNGSSILDAIASFKLSDGSFSHKQGDSSNSTATVQAFYSAVSYSSMKNGGSLYIFDKKETPAPQTTEKETKQEKTTEKPVKTTAEFSQKAAETTVAAETTAALTEATAQTETAKAETEITEKATEEEPAEKKGSYKPWAALVIAVIAVIVCLILLICKKRNFKNYLLVIIIAASGIVFVLLTDFQPADSFYNSADKENSVGTVTMAIRCDTVADKKAAHIPENGVILDKTEFEIESGDTVYDILLDAAAEYRIHIETSGATDTVYVEGIGNIYEMDFGDLSGWMYFVNGSSPNVGCGEYTLSDGDKIEWHYTCDIGKDLSLK